MTMTTEPGVKTAGPTATRQRARLSPAAGAVGGGDLTDHDRRVDHPAGVLHRGQLHLVLLPVRDRDAGVHGDRAQPVRQALLHHRLDVRLCGQGPRCGIRRDDGLGSGLVLLLHRHRRTMRLHADERAVPPGHRRPRHASHRSCCSPSAPRSASPSPTRMCACRRSWCSCSRACRWPASWRCPASSSSSTARRSTPARSS